MATKTAKRQVRLSKHRPRRAKISKIRGFLPTPPEVERLLACELKGRPVTDEARQRLIDTWSLQYYFGGLEVKYRNTARGVEVLAVGVDEIEDLNSRLTPDELETVILDFPSPW